MPFAFSDDEQKNYVYICNYYYYVVYWLRGNYVPIYLYNWLACELSIVVFR